MGLNRVAGTTRQPGANGNTDLARIREHDRRTAIDQFRVALGGANETLAFIGVADDDHDDALALNAQTGRGRRARRCRGS